MHIAHEYAAATDVLERQAPPSRACFICRASRPAEPSATLLEVSLATRTFLQTKRNRNPDAADEQSRHLEPVPENL